MFAVLVSISISECSYTFGDKKGTLSETYFNSKDFKGSKVASIFGSYVAHDSRDHTFRFESKVTKTSKLTKGEFTCSISSWSSKGNKNSAQVYGMKVTNGRTYPFEQKTTTNYYFIELNLTDNGVKIQSSYTFPNKESKCLNGNDVKYDCMPAPTPTPRATPRPTPSASPKPTPSQSPFPTKSSTHQFSVTLLFSRSVGFNSSRIFTHSKPFSRSNSYSKSRQFSRTKGFEQTNVYSKSGEFDATSPFLRSNNFSMTHIFSSSSRFGKTKDFSNSEDFAKSLEFNGTLAFPKSGQFVRSSSFSNTNRFLESHKFTRSKGFSNTEAFQASTQFRETNVFSSSNQFKKSQKFSKTGIFSNTHDFPTSSHFSASNKFSESKEFSNSEKFIQTIRFSSSHLFTKSLTFLSKQQHISSKEHTNEANDLSSEKSMIKFTGNKVTSTKSINMRMSYSIDIENTIVQSEHYLPKSPSYNYNNLSMEDNQIVKQNNAKIQKSNSFVIGLITGLLVIIIIIIIIVFFVKKKQDNSHHSSNDMTTETTEYDTTYTEDMDMCISTCTNDNPLMLNDLYFENLGQEEDIELNLFTEEYVLE